MESRKEAGSWKTRRCYRVTLCFGVRAWPGLLRHAWRHHRSTVARTGTARLSLGVVAATWRAARIALVGRCGFSWRGIPGAKHARAGASRHDGRRASVLAGVASA